MHQEYPKCLYMGGAVDAAYCIVFDSAQEQAARDKGYSSANEPQEKAKPKRMKELNK